MKTLKLQSQSKAQVQDHYLVVDILFSDNKIVLIDEPELGLNPLVKQKSLKLLLTESKKYLLQHKTHVNLWGAPQICIRTHAHENIRGNPKLSTRN